MHNKSTKGNGNTDKVTAQHATNDEKLELFQQLLDHLGDIDFKPMGVHMYLHELGMNDTEETWSN